MRRFPHTKCGIARLDRNSKLARRENACEVVDSAERPRSPSPAHAAEAQAFRWDCFEHSLDGVLPRAYLKRLSDLEDVETEEHALALALR